MLNKVGVGDNLDAIETTRFRSVNRAKEFIAGLRNSTIALTGYHPADMGTEITELLQQAMGNKRTGQDILIGVGGLDVSNVAIAAKSLKTSYRANVVSDALLAAEAEFQVTSASPGISPCVVLYTPHGSGSFDTNEAQSLVFTDCPASLNLVAYNSTADATSAVFYASDTNATIKARLESIYTGQTITVSGSLTTSTDSDTNETLYSGTLTLSFGTAADVAQVQIKCGEQQKLVVASGDGGNYTWNGGGNFVMGATESTVQTNQRALAGSYANVVVKGQSVAYSTGGNLAIAATKTSSGQSDAGTASGGADGSYGTYQSTWNGGFWQCDFGSPQVFDEVVLYMQIGGHYIMSCDVQGSNDGASWVTLHSIADAGFAGEGNGTNPHSFPFSNSTAYRYCRLNNMWGYNGKSQFLECEIIGIPAPASATFNAYFPYSAGNVADPATTGTGATSSTVKTGGSDAGSVAAESTTTAGYSGEAVYNVITATGNGTSVNDTGGATATTNGAEFILQAVGTGSVTCKIQHAPDSSGSPGTWADLTTFDAITGTGSTRKSIASGTSVNPWLRLVVTAVTGKYALAAAVTRL
jgi:hypothetical protein